MSSASRSCSLVIAALFALSAANIASAQQGAAPAERCSGTLCDLYYGGPAPEPQPGAKGTAPKPVTVPQGGLLGMFSGAPSEPAAPGASPPRRLVGVGGGGLSAMARGEAPERCSGTLCDLYYGGPAPEQPEPKAATQAGEQQAGVSPVDADEPAAPSVRYRPMPREKPHCAPRPGDPWSCYR